MTAADVKVTVFDNGEAGTFRVVLPSGRVAGGLWELGTYRNDFLSGRAPLMSDEDQEKYEVTTRITEISVKGLVTSNDLRGIKLADIKAAIDKARTPVNA